MINSGIASVRRPTAAPVIDPEWDDQDSDLTEMRAAIQRCGRLTVLSASWEEEEKCLKARQKAVKKKIQAKTSIIEAKKRAKEEKINRERIARNCSRVAFPRNRDCVGFGILWHISPGQKFYITDLSNPHAGKTHVCESVYMGANENYYGGPIFKTDEGVLVVVRADCFAKI